MLNKLIVCLGLVVAFLVSGCVIQPVDSPFPTVGESSFAQPSGDNEAIGAYQLKPLDPIFLRFSGVMDQMTIELVIDENGEISLLHLSEPVLAAGLTTSALEDEIERRYIAAGIYKNVAVNVTMTAKVYYIYGEVNAPGQFPLLSGTTLLQAIAGARGYTPFANRKKVTLTRSGQVASFNTKEMEKDPSKDVKIEAGDVINVLQSAW